MCSCFIIERLLCCARVGNHVMSFSRLHVARFMLLGFCLHHKNHQIYIFSLTAMILRTFMTENIFSFYFFLGNLCWKFDEIWPMYDEQNLKSTHTSWFLFTFPRWKGPSMGKNCMSHHRHALLVLRLEISGFLSLSPKH